MRAASAGLNLTDSVYEQLLRERIIVLGSQVEENIANQICAQLLWQALRPAACSDPHAPTVGGSLRTDSDSDCDRWFTAEEAREYGFVDQVLTRANSLPDASR